MYCLRTENLTKLYSNNGLEIPALKNVNLRVERGEFVSLVGPSGSGKTTLLNLIGGLDMPTTGTVFVDDRDITGMSERQRSDLRLASIGFIFQEFNLIPVLSARENVEYVMLLQGVSPGEAQQRAVETLAAVGLQGLEDRRPNQLSGGQQQRVTVARAIATGPSIVLADEPTANLDSETGHNLVDTMRQLNDELDITFLLSTHDPMVIDSTTRVIRMRDGALLEEA
ncbi:MAG TPA: ABC transporter ATP-binding protein [Gammaproteobacteria bacterium]|nr:ABC transporter ATP-binding protein [Gammaproteobacteria bacterium]